MGMKLWVSPPALPQLGMLVHTKLSFGGGGRRMVSKSISASQRVQGQLGLTETPHLKKNKTKDPVLAETLIANLQMVLAASLQDRAGFHVR